MSARRRSQEAANQLDSLDHDRTRESTIETNRDQTLHSFERGHAHLSEMDVTFVVMILQADVA
jgi:hypothetical protein